MKSSLKQIPFSKSSIEHISINEIKSITKAMLGIKTKILIMASQGVNRAVAVETFPLERRQLLLIAKILRSQGFKVKENYPKHTTKMNIVISW